MTKRYCEKCGTKTEHKEQMQPKPVLRPKTVVDILKQLVSSELYSYQIGNADLLDRYVVCKICGTKRLENIGQEFE